MNGQSRQYGRTLAFKPKASPRNLIPPARSSMAEKFAWLAVHCPGVMRSLYRQADAVIEDMRTEETEGGRR